MRNIRNEMRPSIRLAIGVAPNSPPHKSMARCKLSAFNSFVTYLHRSVKYTNIFQVFCGLEQIEVFSHINSLIQYRTYAHTSIANRRPFEPNHWLTSILTNIQCSNEMNAMAAVDIVFDGVSWRGQTDDRVRVCARWKAGIVYKYIYKRM